MAQEARRLRQHLLTCPKCIEEMTNDSTPRWKAIPFMTTDTPRTDACPHCGAEYFDAVQWECGTTPIIDGDTLRSPLCKEREARQKAEAEVERLKVLICLEEASFGKATPLNVEEELRKIREMRAGLAPMNAKEIDAAKRVPLDQNTEIEQLNIAGATAVEAAKLFKQRAEKAESLYGHQKEELAALQDSVERLRTALQSCYWATNTYDGNYTRACDDVATIAINALKTQDK